ncbi:hypothetical protein BDM02DRAFT_715581 [Thelephora ganbajun]|uniref:Uncharacterized protein n=1 Tax=Thelephora ganbajun TaxID=370292 RepID=A0ACB6Z690_THEGA|nr:hypothetical protein BDM02DRAFT_715581 [Thelephora ganbajun]
MVAGIVSHPSGQEPLSLTLFLIIAYTPPDTSFYNETTEDREQQARKVAERPELRIISRACEELADALGISGFQCWGCNDYVLAEIKPDGAPGGCDIVLSPQDIVIVKVRDRRDHVDWLVDRQRYGGAGGAGEVRGLAGWRYQRIWDRSEVNSRRLDICVPKCVDRMSSDGKAGYSFSHREARSMLAVIPYVPTENSKPDRLVYEVILTHFLGVGIGKALSSSKVASGGPETILM